ncbi:DegV family protein [Companilactobacillus sp. DQM5]|uniref:DegV family protein n=1 Tax=Companilactobacillus sp. DQM5 TaxID=3463359 RepID=UPI004058418D
MAKVRIVTDSSAQLSNDEIKNNNIKVVPLDIVIDGKQFIDGVDITRDEFIEKMKSSKQLPTTSQPPIGSFTSVYEEILNEDPETKIISIHMLEDISGTVNAARQAAEMTEGDIIVVDSQFTDWGLTFQVLKAAQLANENKDVEEILVAIKEIRDKTELRLGVVTIENILRGGRLGRFAATISTVLNINLALEVANGKLSIVKRGRGRKTIDKYVETIIERIKNNKDIKFIGISDCDAKDYCQEVKEKIEKVAPNVEVEIRTTSPIISTHTGVGAFAIIFY